MPTNGLKWGGTLTITPADPSTTAPYAPGGIDVLGEQAQRERRVELFRRAVAAGTYRVDSGTIADRLIECDALALLDDR